MGSTNYEELAVLERIEHDLRRIADSLQRIATELTPTFDLPGTTATMAFTE